MEEENGKLEVEESDTQVEEESNKQEVVLIHTPASLVGVESDNRRWWGVINRWESRMVNWRWRRVIYWGRRRVINRRWW